MAPYVIDHATILPGWQLVNEEIHISCEGKIWKRKCCFWVCYLTFLTAVHTLSRQLVKSFGYGGKREEEWSPSQIELSGSNIWVLGKKHEPWHSYASSIKINYLWYLCTWYVIFICWFVWITKMSASFSKKFSNLSIICRFCLVIRIVDK